MKIKLPVLVLILTLFILSCKQRVYRASSSSMEKTLVTGQSFMVTKADEFNKNDIVVFDIFSNDFSSPPDYEQQQWKKHWEKRVYRLIAVSGDTLQIKNGDVFVNGRLFPFPEKGMMDYEVLSDNPIPELDEKDINEVFSNREGSKFKYTFAMPKEEAKLIETKPGIVSVDRYIRKADDYPTPLAVPASNLNWTVDNYGPIRIPVPGETIFMDSANSILFQNIPGISKGNFKINEKLYFLMGDNRHRASDSRYDGFISHSKMYGVVK
jgi:signal peptidase I